jgi:hypothetical protein
VTTIAITVAEYKRTQNATLYEATLGNTVLCRSRTPFYAAARALMEQGFDPEATLEMSWRNSPIVSMRQKLCRAAQLTVKENDHRFRVEPYVPAPDKPKKDGERKEKN